MRYPGAALAKPVALASHHRDPSNRPQSSDPPAMTAFGPDHLARFAAIVGDRHVVTDPTTMAPYLVEWRDLYRGRSPVVVRPGSTAEVAALMQLADAWRVPVIPQGGNTGLVGGQIPDETGAEIVLSLGRMNRIRALDSDGNTLTAEAGVTLQAVQEAADAADRLFPLTLGSQGSCTVGGNLATNAGGTAVLAYGNARDLTLGLEVVLADGQVWNGLRALRKDNTGYDLKQVFLGSEGTLGIITAAVLKLFARPRARAVAFVGVEHPRFALRLLDLAKSRADTLLTGFELMPQIGIDFAVRHLAGARAPLATPAPWSVLIELSSGGTDEALRGLMEEILTLAYERDIITDAAIADTLAQAADFWRLRHGLSEVQKFEGGSIKHDISVAVSRVPEFLDRAIAAVTALVPGCRPVPFGHMGDGNIHFNVSQPVGADKAAFLAGWDAMNTVVHDIVMAMEGSIAAEHGVGRLKRDLMLKAKSPVELAMMRALKATFDPNGILSPGRILPRP
jgi:FAD/FMN-containing dehydrogenase